jgi:hypothetical protein
MERVANTAAFSAAAPLVILASFAILRAFLSDLFAFAGRFLPKFQTRRGDGKISHVFCAVNDGA